ncbi:MAG TPA: thiamine diphosphokinase [Candidatus Kapabacteria bacterium]|jgi:thiamine pyrophosphokinase|nr:thiamine diphosphokinase [Candidatus Kapabacteria bacterium]
MGVIAARRALVALAGTLPDRAVLEDLRREHATLVAADGAAIALDALGMRPDVVIGDLDSIGSLRGALEESGATVVEEASQESNDFEKALVWIAESGLVAATVVGIDGGMIDHTLNNFSVLARHARRLELTIRSADAIGYCIAGRDTEDDTDTTGDRRTGHLELDAAEGERVSLIPLPSARVTTRGLAWELTDETLAIGIRDGASNRALGVRVRVEVSEGVLLVVHFPGAMARFGG